MDAVHADLDPLAQDYEPVFWRYYLWAIKYFAQFHYLSQKAAIAAGRIATFDASPLVSVLSMQWFKATLEKLEEYRLTKAGQDLEMAMAALKELLKVRLRATYHRSKAPRRLWPWRASAMTTRRRLPRNTARRSCMTRPTSSSPSCSSYAPIRPRRYLWTTSPRVSVCLRVPSHVGSPWAEAVHAALSLMEIEAGSIVVKKKRAISSTLTAADKARESLGTIDENADDERDEDEGAPRCRSRRTLTRISRGGAVALGALLPHHGLREALRVSVCAQLLPHRPSPLPDVRPIIILRLTPPLISHSNAARVNHAVVAMFMRLAKDLELHHLFYHVRLFRDFVRLSIALTILDYVFPRVR